MLSKFVLSIGSLSLVFFMLSGPLRADTTYTYTGNSYNFCVGTYTGSSSNNVCAQPYAVSLTFDTSLSGTQLDNLTLNSSRDVASGHCSGCTGIAPIMGDLTASITSFSFTDGSGFSVTNADTADYGFDITTDSNGNILAWFIYAQSYPPFGTGSFFQALTESGLGLGAVADGTLLESYDGTVAGTEVSGNLTEVGGGDSDSTASPLLISGSVQWTMTVPEPSSLPLTGIGMLGILALAARTKRLEW